MTQAGFPDFTARQLRAPGPLLLFLVIGLSVIPGCQVGDRQQRVSWTSPDDNTDDLGPSQDPGSPSPASGAPGPMAMPIMPASTHPGPVEVPPPEAPVSPPAQTIEIGIDREPVVGVLISHGAQVYGTLLGPAEVRTEGGRWHLSAGRLLVESGVGGLHMGRIGSVGTEASLRVSVPPGMPAFSIATQSASGRTETLRLAGDFLLREDPRDRTIEVIEHLPMEAYLAGVLAKEINPHWPLAALEAQAIAARSYATARYCQRIAQPWQISASSHVDMAYGGWRPMDGSDLQRAVGLTRGRLLMYHGWIVPALFSASSGGETESVANVLDDLHVMPGTAEVSAVMPAVRDPADLPGAEGMGLTATHWQWRAMIPLAEVRRDLESWERAQGPAAPVIGVVLGIRILDRFADSGRVARIEITERVNGRERHLSMTGCSFRMAVGPGRVRSTLWQRCVVASANGGEIVIQGRGFGHGVGLSQISAWYLARQGVDADAILARFYPGAIITRRW